MEVTTKKIFTAKISSIKNLAPDIKEFIFKIDEPFTFISGQYVWVEIGSERRAFSRLPPRQLGYCRTQGEGLNPQNFTENYGIRSKQSKNLFGQ
ncbi:MAG: hypothetical protein UT58_C0018G0005 [Microgenomates group bacterium GW2011_GWC1_39_7b]|uniref:Uncharacterized protein n=1 Tax=Candidatus Woesebacteria bacterium GW2011_GWA2_40_7 TaxID=1618562 RepID=A0A0G0TAJ3_9BACT|nr:MAG: hypothetical protein UT58_C0018G0005 [Microgenomates group bacterium GW2011_GWC1_39_7b]KKR71826.1 MAG: hypothetical protein UU16_C0052G0003 [Candidatus Woesebacteria bacterium GW2011_GWA2_40_7]